MNRFGWALLTLFVLLAGGFALLVRPSVNGPETQSAPLVVGKPSDLVLPVAGVLPARLVDSFRDPRGGGTHGHGALDIPAARGTAVLAAAPGTVEKLFESEAGGHTVYVRSGDARRVYYYAHLDAYAPGLHEGQRVAAGERIASVGSTGNADPAGPHLHFEVKDMAPGETWYQGRDIDPYPLLTRR